MKNFKYLLSELNSTKTKKVSFTFGRFQGLTIGHEKLLEKLFSDSGDHRVFISQTVGDKKNPLSVEFKQKLLKELYPEHKNHFLIEYKTPFDAARFLVDSGYTDITMYVGEDRERSFKDSFKSSFPQIKIKSVGERDGSSKKEVERSSAQKLRELARAGSKKEFNDLAHGGMTADQKQRMFNELRRAYGEPEIDISEAEKLREDYVSGKIFKVGDYVTEGSNAFKIVDRCSNYVRVMDRDGNVSRKWLTNLQPQRDAHRTFAESVKTAGVFSFNGYIPKIENERIIEAFSKFTVSKEDQYAILESIKETEKFLNSSDLKDIYEGFSKSGDYLTKLGVIESHQYRSDFEKQIASKLIESVEDIGRVLSHDKEKIVQLFADILGVNKGLNVESTMLRCVNEINSVSLTEAQKKIYTKFVDVILEEGVTFDFYKLNYIKESFTNPGTVRDVLMWASAKIDELGIDDIITLYQDGDVSVLKESNGQKKVVVNNPIMDGVKIQRKAKQIAVQYMKHRKSRKAVDQLTSQEKKKIEEIVNQRGSVLTMISRKLGKKIKKIEADRMAPSSSNRNLENLNKS